MDNSWRYALSDVLELIELETSHAEDAGADASYLEALDWVHGTVAEMLTGYPNEANNG